MFLNLPWLNAQAQKFAAAEPEKAEPPEPTKALTPESVILTVLDDTPRTLSELYDALKQVQLGVGYPALIAIVNDLVSQQQARRDSLEDGVQVYFKTKPH